MNQHTQPLASASAKCLFYNYVSIFFQLFTVFFFVLNIRLLRMKID